MTAELLVQWNTEKDTDLQSEWAEVLSFIPLNTSFTHRFDALYGRDEHSNHHRLSARYFRATVRGWITRKQFTCY